jgi:hypothetical protein
VPLDNGKRFCVKTLRDRVVLITIKDEAAESHGWNATATIWQSTP